MDAGMNKIFEKISLAAGGSHYPTINPDLQQKFGELIVQQITDQIQRRIHNSQSPLEATVLSELQDEILRSFELEWMDSDWDAQAELQKIFDEFDIGNANK